MTLKYNLWNENYRRDVLAFDSGSIPQLTKLVWSRSTLQERASLTVPGFRKLIADGLCATGGFYRYGKRYTNIGGFAWCRVNYPGGLKGEWWYSGPAFDQGLVPSLPSAAEISACTDECSRKYFAKLREARTKVQGGTVLAELAEAARMIRNPMKGLRDHAAKYLSKLGSMKRKLRNASGSTKTRALSEAWLEEAFGWSPLIADAKGAAQAFSEAQNHFNANWVPVRARNDWSAATMTTSAVTGSRVQFLRNTRNSRSVTVKLLGLMDSSSTDPIVMGLENFGFRPEEFVPTAWEVIPWSFVADYFANFNDMINAWSYRNTAMRWSQLTTYIEGRIANTMSDNCQNYLRTQGNVGEYDGSGCSATGLTPDFSESRVQRGVVSLPNLIPSLRFKVPGMPQTLNLAALFAARKKIEPLW